MTNSLMALLVGTAILVAALASWLVLRWSHSAKTPQSLSPDERYRKPEGQFIPRIGGVAIALGFASSLLLGLCFLQDTVGLLYSTWLPSLLTIGSMFTLGLWDVLSDPPVDLQPVGLREFFILTQPLGLQLHGAKL